MADYSDKVDAVLDRCGDFDRDDFLLLAQAAIDQAGVGLTTQDKVAALLGLEMEAL